MLRKLGIEPGEGRIFAWGAAVLFLLGWTEVSIKNASEVLFNKNVGVEFLPLAFLINSIMLVATTYAIGVIAARRDRLGLLPQVMIALAVILVPLWILVIRGYESVFWLLIIASKQIDSIGLLVFWLAMGDLLHGRQAKRLFAPLIAGVTVGSILGSFASEPISRVTGIAGVLPISAGALVLAALASRPLRGLRAARLERGAPAESRAAPTVGPGAEALRSATTGLGTLWTDNRLFRLLFVVTLCSGLVGPMLYFQFQYVADVATQGADGQEQLMAFYAQFRGWMSVGILVIQLGIASNLYRRIGVPLAAAVSPAIYLLGFTGLTLRLSLPAGVAAMAGSKLQDDAVFDPAVRVLFNLFPESIRPRAMAILEGPIKRGGGALGNVACMAAIQGLGSVRWVGVIAMPVAALWLVIALILWRAYPQLLMQASLRRSHIGEDFDAAEFLDANTLRALAGYLRDPDPVRCRVAIELVSEAAPASAGEILAEAAVAAPEGTKPMLVEALMRVLEASVLTDVRNSAAAAHVADLLASETSLGALERAYLIRALGRFASDGFAAKDPKGLFASALEDAAPGVRLAAAAALHRLGSPPPGIPDLAAALREAARDSDPVLRRIGRQEYRALLISDDAPGVWADRLDAFAELPVEDDERAEVLEILADVAKHRGEPAAVVEDRVLRWRGDPDPRLRAAIIRYIGYAGLSEHAGWIVGHLGGEEGSDGDAIPAAAREALRALGVRAADALLVELSFGKRSVRDAILPLVRELDVAADKMRELYERELTAIRRILLELHGAAVAGLSPILLQRLGERLDETISTALHLLAAVHDDDRIAKVAVPLRRARGTRQYAILLEALEAMLSPSERDDLLPLLEDRSAADRGRVAAQALGIPVPGGAEVEKIVLESPDPLTRSIASLTLEGGRIGESGVARSGELGDAPAVLTPVERAMLLRSVPLFEGMTTRQLMHVAEVVEQEVFEPNTVVAREGDYSDCMYIIADGRVAIMKGDTVLNVLGPNDFFGEIAVFEGTTRSADVSTQGEPVSLLRLGRDDLLSLMEELPGIAICVCQTLSRRVRSLTERVNA